MTNIIVTFAKIEDAKRIKNILVKNGFCVSAVCTGGVQTLGMVDELHEGIIISGYRLSDMICIELKSELPAGFEMVVLASAQVLSECAGSDIMGLAMPLKVNELVNTINMMCQGLFRRKRKQPKKPCVRNEQDIAIINSAKCLLIERNKMTEEEAHRYLQKHSMDNGTNMVETAQMLLALK